MENLRRRGVKQKPNNESVSRSKGRSIARVFVKFLVFLAGYESVLFYSGESDNILLDHGGRLLEVFGDTPHLPNDSTADARSRHESPSLVANILSAGSIGDTQHLALSSANNNFAAEARSRPSSTTLVMDIISAGSKTRPDLLKAQLKTWAMPHTGIIRNVYQATEEDDCDQVCRNATFTQEGVEEVKTFCRKYKLRPKQGSWYMKRNINMRFLHGDKQPGWVCAQKRPILALVKVLRGYIQQDPTDLPDFLMLVDDDTWYNVDQLADILRAKDASSAYVAAGCKTIHNQIHTVYHGGMGLVLSRGSLERLLRPLHGENHGMSTDMEDNGWWKQWEAHFHEKLAENLAFERDLFVPGMSIVDLMDAYVKAESYDTVERWTKGFCFHSDNFLSYIMEHYWIHGASNHTNGDRGHDEIMDVLFPSETMQDVGGIAHYGLCVIKGVCRADSPACHFQTPVDMLERTNRVLANRQVK